jgi:hypothetical protein
MSPMASLQNMCYTIVNARPPEDLVRTDALLRPACSEIFERYEMQGARSLNCLVASCSLQLQVAEVEVEIRLVRASKVVK